MADAPRDHWQTVYGQRSIPELSWYQPKPERSLELIRETGVPPTAPILDVGGGASTLVDYLLAAAFTDLTVLDVAPLALAAARARLGRAAGRVHWITTDITEFRPSRRYALWHDRAVLHFLRDPVQRQHYLDVLEAALAPVGNVILATFGPDGPTHCSGLEVQRYSADQLSALLGSGFDLVQSVLEDHVTPGGQRQQFLYGWWRANSTATNPASRL
jgi:trans-aconitate methyltransferase